MSLMGPEDWFAEVEGSTPLRAAGRVVPYAEVGIRDEAGNSQPPDGISCKEDATCLEHSARATDNAARQTNQPLLPVG